jgi:hypothetical protein
VDEQRHHDAHVNGGRRHVGLWQHCSWRIIHQDVLVYRDLSISLHDSSGHDRHGQRPMSAQTAATERGGIAMRRYVAAELCPRH